MRDHRSLIAWQAGMDLAVGASFLARTRWHPASRHGFDQLVRASLSAPLNISEGYVWRPEGKWAYHLRVAYGSLVEAGDAIEYLLRVSACPPSDLAEIRANLRTAQRTTLALLKKSTLEIPRSERPTPVHHSPFTVLRPGLAEERRRR